MSLFTVGKRYQGEYMVEHVVSFFNGELAISQFLDDRYYLQSVPLVREFTTLEFHRFKKLYDELDLELLLPVSDMFLEGNNAVFVYPYEPIQPIRDVVMGAAVSDDQIISWFNKIIQTEMALQSMGIPMYMIRDPRNIGLNTAGELRVIFSAIEDVTLFESTVNWGTFFYCIVSGEYVDESLKKLPSKHSISKPVAKIIQKSFKAKNLQDLFSIVDQALRKRKGGGLIESIFGKKKKKEPSTDQNSQSKPDPLTIETTTSNPSVEETQQMSQDQTTFDWSQPIDNQQKQDNVLDEKERHTLSSHSEQVNEPGPFEQQLEQMYQSLEQESQTQKPSLEETQVFTNQNQNTDSTNQQLLDESQLLHTQDTQSNTVISTHNESQLFTSQNQTESQDQSLDFKRKGSQESTSTVDETQIFSASDLESLEAELEALQRERESEQLKQTKQEQKEMEQTIIQPQGDDLAQLENLFGELEQLQQDQTTIVASQSNTSSNESVVVKPESNTEAGEKQSVAQEQSDSNLDLKVKELENLFDELNQIQLNENTTAAVEEAQAIPKVETQEIPKEKKSDTGSAKSEENHVSPQQEPKEKEKTPREEDPLEKLRREFDEEQKILLERQRQKLQERQQALIDEAQEELKRRQQELLKEIEQQEEKMLLELEEEFKKRKLREMKKMELNTLRKKHDQDVVRGLEEIEKEYQELEKQELEQLDQEFSRRKQEIINHLNEKRSDREKEFKAKKEKEWEELLKKFKEEETADEDEQTEGSANRKESKKEKDQGSSNEKKKTQSAKKSRRKTKKSKNKNNEMEKSRLQKKRAKEDKKNNDELASQFDEYKKELYSEDPKKEETEVTSEDNKNT